MAGLGIEVLGLAFLFFDLLKTKESDRHGEALETFLADLQSGRGELAATTARVFAKLIKPMFQIAELPRGEPLTDAARELFLENLEQAQLALPSEELWTRAKAADLVAQTGIVQRWKDQAARTRRLIAIARAGVALVLFGAFCQLLDLVI